MGDDGDEDDDLDDAIIDDRDDHRHDEVVGVDTHDARYVSEAGAVLRGEVYEFLFVDGTAEVWFDIWAAENPDRGFTVAAGEIDYAQIIEAEVDGLEPGTKYEFRLIVQTDESRYEGDHITEMGPASFTTKQKEDDEKDDEDEDEGEDEGDADEKDGDEDEEKDDEKEGDDDDEKDEDDEDDGGEDEDDADGDASVGGESDTDAA